ncbi:MAG: hypothetical protein PHY11_05105 [Bacilli bacterium]|nr:hypothetical protein [Bacilli bacterium]
MVSTNKKPLESLYTQKFSLLRVITNSVGSVVAIIIFLAFAYMFFDPTLYSDTSMLITLIIVEVVLILYILLHCFTEFKYSLFNVDREKIVFHRFNRPKKLDTIYIKDVTKIGIRSLNVVVEDDKGHKLVLEYLAKPKELAKKLADICDLKQK